MKEEDVRRIKIELSEPTPVTICIVSVMFFLSLMTVGGCFVDGHYKVKAIQAQPDRMEVVDRPLPLQPNHWIVREKDD